MLPGGGKLRMVPTTTDRLEEEFSLVMPQERRRRKRAWRWVASVVALSVMSMAISRGTRRGEASLLARPVSRAFGLSLRAVSECGGSSVLWAYTIRDAPAEGVTLAEPGCPVAVRLEGDGVSRWGLSRIWSGRAWKSAVSRATLRRSDESSSELVLWEPGLYRAEATAAKTGVVLSVLLRCLYVRREVRDLTATQRDAYLRALGAVFSSDEERERMAHASGYRSIAHIARRHVVGASARSGDQLHDGLGFLPQHMALSNEFEKALQAVDARVALPYWDFTRDAEGGSGPGNPALWDETKGVFAWRPRVDSQLRAPWNFSPSPLVTRPRAFCGVSHDLSEWPTCAEHRGVVDADSLEQLLLKVQGPAHGIVHMMLGGLAGCGETLASLDRSILLSMKDYLQLAWRLDLLEFAENASYACVPREAWELRYFDNPEANRVIIRLADVPDRDAVYDALCDGESTWIWGEQAGADSPWDPSFWPMHPTLDRLFQYKRLVDPETAIDWPTSPSRSCKWEEIGAACVGHRPRDLTAFTSTVLDDGVYESRQVTNIEMLRAADPRDYRLDYIYDDFAWDHCADTFDNLTVVPEPLDAVRRPRPLVHSDLCDALGVYVADQGCASRAVPVARGVDVVAYASRFPFVGATLADKLDQIDLTSGLARFSIAWACAFATAPLRVLTDAAITLLIGTLVRRVKKRPKAD
mmetsp:Transcript_6339/g.19217  ORF Transcript_6339/g.19217 Transcript_6339/m.19217 type:complete len:696 (-) Transcript_6339:220-2307(-)